MCGKRVRFFRPLGLLVLHLVIAGVAADTAHAQAAQASDGAEQSPPDTRGMFERNALGIELGLGFLGEAWNLNDNGREWLADGNIAVWWTFHPRVTLVVDFHATRVFQEHLRNAFVNGLMPLVRWQLAGTRTTRVFMELGPGVSWSDTAVPKRGTRFNYLAQISTGVSHRVGPATDVVAAFRWFHLSNAGREGQRHNPDIESLGGYAGVAIGF
jgi:hypothetical protein